MSRYEQSGGASQPIIRGQEGIPQIPRSREGMEQPRAQGTRVFGSLDAAKRIEAAKPELSKEQISQAHSVTSLIETIRKSSGIRGSDGMRTATELLETFSGLRESLRTLLQMGSVVDPQMLQHFARPFTSAEGLREKVLEVLSYPPGVAESVESATSFEALRAALRGVGAAKIERHGKAYTQKQLEDQVALIQGLANAGHVEMAHGQLGRVTSAMGLRKSLLKLLPEGKPREQVPQDLSNVVRMERPAGLPPTRESPQAASFDGNQFVSMDARLLLNNKNVPVHERLTRAHSVQDVLVVLDGMSGVMSPSGWYSIDKVKEMIRGVSLALVSRNEQKVQQALAGVTRGENLNQALSRIAGEEMRTWPNQQPPYRG
ncbi:hypothetical protein KBA73_05465 [Patescibacteria group bacterium]|nr:hypothetical protein [Patescibacteria group bacterium]